MLVDGHYVVLTTHAVERYRQRVDGGVTRSDLEQLVKAHGRVRFERPGWAGIKHPSMDPTDAWLLLPGRQVTFPMRLSDGRDHNLPLGGGLVALSCKKKRRPSKAVVRWRREQALEDAWAA